MSDIITKIDQLEQELDSLRPLQPETVARVAQKLRIEFCYHSNAVEGNSLTLGETRSLILHGLTARGKPMRHHIDIQGYNEAILAIEEAAKDEHILTQAFIRNLHATILKESYRMPATTPDGGKTSRRIEIGMYKTVPNNVQTSTGEIYFFTAPEQVSSEMSDLIGWYNESEAQQMHPIVIAATFHYRFVRIHPFDDGNGRMARLLMNLILIRHGYTVAIVQQKDRSRYIEELESVDRSEELANFIDYIASCCEYSLDIHLRAARGDSIDDVDDIDREIALFKRDIVNNRAPEQQIIARKHVDKVVYPFRDYCQSKLAKIKGEFVSLDYDGWNIAGKGVEGSIFSFEHDAHRHVASIPEYALQMSSVFFIFASGFRGTSVGFRATIENYHDFRKCDWHFALNNRRLESYDGKRDVELKLRFNQLLREAMADLREKA